jgi:hypothetical protein
MAAVFCLVFLFALASVFLLVKTIVAGAGLASVVAMLMFVALASGVFLGLLKMTKGWEAEAGPEH